MEIIISLFLLLVLFVGYETAFIAAYQSEDELSKVKSSGIVRYLFNRGQQLVATLLIGKYLALTLAVYFLYSFIFEYFNVSSVFLVVIISILVLSVVLILLVDYLPKVFFKQRPLLWLQSFAWLIAMFYFLVFPLAKLICWFLAYKTKDGVAMEEGNNVFSLINLNFLLSESSSANEVLSGINNEVRIIQNVLDFSNVKLRDCLVPRTDMVALEYGADMQSLKQMFIETGLSKILVYKKDIDNIVGYIHSSELFKSPKEWQRQINTIPIVPENMAAQKLMRTFMHDKKSIAVVVDEFGGTSGIVTLEDIMEEIFGEIEDEHDVRSHTAVKTAENEYILSGKLEVDEINETFHLDIPTSEDYSTLAGYILQEYQHFPKLNEIIEIGKYTFKFLKVSSNRIELVKMSIKT